MRLSLLMVLFGILVLSTTASASGVGLTVTPSGEAWVEEVVTVTSSCDSGSNVYGKISGPMIANLPSFSYDGQQWTSSFYPSLLLNTLDGGSYEINVTCENGGIESESEALTLYGLFLVPLSPKTNEFKVAYPGEDLKVVLNFSRDSSPINNAEFKVKLGNTVIFDSESGDIPVFNSLTQLWEISARIPEYTSTGDYDLTIEAKYKEHIISEVVYNAVEVRSSVEVNIVEPLSLYPFRLSESNDVPLVLTIKYKSEPVSKYDVQGFVAKLEDQDLLIKEISYSPSNWSLLVNIPEFTPRKDVYNLDIYVNYKGELVKSVNSLPIQFLMKFEGTLVDATGTPVSGAEIKIKGGGIEERSVTGSSGNYSISIVPGVYDLELYLPEMSARISDVNLSSTEYLSATDLIKYDYSSQDTVDGMPVAKLVALEADLEFDEAYIEIPYMDSRVTDEDSIRVLACHEWNFGRRTCLGEWEELDADINTVRNIVSFEIDRFSAFAITEAETLLLDASFDKSEYKPDETATITGRVTSAMGEVIKSARITYEVEETGEKGSTTTDDSGSFMFEIKTPSSKGIFNVDINAEKSPYAPAELTISREVTERKSLTISVDSSIDLQLYEEKSLIFRVSNTGDADLRSIEFALEGINSEWYSLSRTRIEELRKGEEREVTITFQIPKDFCSRYECKSQYSVTIRADSDEASTSKAFTLNLIGLEKPSVTGFFAFNLTNVAIVIALLVVIVLLEKKRRGFKPSGFKNFRYHFRRKERLSLVSSLNKIKSEIVKK